MIKKKPTRSYLIRDNGGRPFKVTIKGKKAFISVIQDYPGENNKVVYEPIVRRTLGPLEFSFIQDFIGVDNYDKIVGKKIEGYKPTPSSKTKGNSILFQVTSDKPKQYKYIYIGSEIYSFYTNEIIEKYHSPIGNNDVPYPYAISENNIYLMLEKIVLNKNAVKLKDPYAEYYFTDHKTIGLKPKKLNTKILVKRLGFWMWVFNYNEEKEIKRELFILKQGTTFDKIKNAIYVLSSYLCLPNHSHTEEIYDMFEKFEKDETKDLKLRNIIIEEILKDGEFVVEAYDVIGSRKL